MKKTLIALAALAATGAVFAQSSVTLYGKVNVSVQKSSDSAVTMGDIHGSRLGFRGTEDLGGGLKANFGIEHRFTPDNGAQAGSVMWNGFTYVGLSGGFGDVKLGRYYSANFVGANNKADPFGGDGAGALRGIGMQTSTLAGFVRTDNVIHYSGTFSGVSVNVSTGVKETLAKAQNSFAISYANGPLAVGAGSEKGAPGTLTNFFATYDLGVAKLAAGMGTTKSAAGAKTQGYLVGATIPAGPGNILVGYANAKTKNPDVTTNSKVGLGYVYPLSKRTSVEFNVGSDSKLTTNKTGYDLTLQHNF